MRDMGLDATCSYGIRISQENIEQYKGIAVLINTSYTNMKRFIIIQAILAFSVISMAQGTNDKLREQALNFLHTRTLSFDTGQIPQEVSNIKAELASLKRTNINYTHSVHSFYGNSIFGDAWMGLSCECRDGGIAKPFIKYQIIQSDGITYLEVLFGSKSW